MWDKVDIQLQQQFVAERCVMGTEAVQQLAAVTGA